MKALREHFTSIDYLHKLFQTVLTTSEQNKAKFKSYLSQIDQMLYVWYGNYLTIDDTVEFNNTIIAWWDISVQQLNRIYALTMPEDTDGITYDPLNDYNISEGTTRLNSQGTLQIEDTIDDPARTSAHYTSTNDNASSGRLEGYTVTGQGNTVPVSGTAMTLDNTRNTSFTDNASLTDHTGATATANRVEVVKHDKSGSNTKPQELAQEEIDLRRNTFMHYFAEMFERDLLSGSIIDVD